MVFCFFGIFQKLLFSDNLLFSYMLSHHISRGPGCLQIEATGDGIDVEHFAGKEEVWAYLALQGMQVDVAEADAAAGNKLLLEVEGTKRSVYLRESPKMMEEPRIEIVR